MEFRIMYYSSMKFGIILYVHGVRDHTVHLWSSGSHSDSTSMEFGIVYYTSMEFGIILYTHGVRDHTIQYIHGVRDHTLHPLEFGIILLYYGKSNPYMNISFSWEGDRTLVVICLDQAVPGRVQDHDAGSQGGLQALQQRRQGPHRPPPATRRGTATGSSNAKSKSNLGFDSATAGHSSTSSSSPTRNRHRCVAQFASQKHNLEFDSATAGHSSTSYSYPTRSRHRCSSIPSQEQSWVRFSDGRALIDLLQLPTRNPHRCVAQLQVKSNLGFDSATAEHSLTRVSTEFRRCGIPYVFCTSVTSVFRAELLKIPRNFAEFHTVYLDKISRNSVIFHEQLRPRHVQTSTDSCCPGTSRCRIRLCSGNMFRCSSAPTV